MTDTVTASLIGGCFGLFVKVLEMLLDFIKHRDSQSSAFEAQRQDFMKALTDRLEKVNKERDEAEAEAEQYREKFWHEYEERLKRLEGR